MYQYQESVLMVFAITHMCLRELYVSTIYLYGLIMVSMIYEWAEYVCHFHAQFRAKYFINTVLM